MNEAAILSVRAAGLEDSGNEEAESGAINMFHIRDAIEKVKLGLPQEGLPKSKAKKFLVTVQAGRAVALAITPGIPEIDLVTTKPQGSILGRIYFYNREYGQYGDKWHQLVYPGFEVNAVKLDRKLSTFEICVGLLIPLYSGRVTEEILFGSESVTLSSSEDISIAGDLAQYLVTQSNLHPAFRFDRICPSLLNGEQTYHDANVGQDGRQRGSNAEKHFSLVRTLCFASTGSDVSKVRFCIAFRCSIVNRTRRLIDQYRHVIEKVADHIYEDERETITGAEIVELIRTTPLAESDIEDPSFDFEEAFKAIGGLEDSEDYIEYKGASGSCSFLHSMCGEVRFGNVVPSMT